MRNDILYPYALDKVHSIVKAVDAPRSDIYSCMNCGERMVLRRGEIKRPYFAHHTENPNCSPETVLHKMAKDNIKAGIDAALSSGFKYPFTWRCHVCNQEHVGDLALSPRDVNIEVSLDGVRPDILLSSMEGKPMAAIEVVVSHSPDQDAIEAYKRLKLPVLMVKPGWEDLKDLKSGLAVFETLNVPCRALKCPKCHQILHKIKASSMYGHRCWKCHNKISVLWFDSMDPWPSWSTQESKISIARKVGIELKWMYSKAETRKYIAHFCPSCGVIQGDAYIYNIGAWEHGIENYREDESTECYICPHCEKLFDKPGNEFKQKKGSQNNDRPETFEHPAREERGFQ